jgi:hypothetical protein
MLLLSWNQQFFCQFHKFGVTCTLTLNMQMHINSGSNYNMLILLKCKMCKMYNTYLPHIDTYISNRLSSPINRTGKSNFYIPLHEYTIRKYQICCLLLSFIRFDFHFWMFHFFFIFQKYKNILKVFFQN